MVDGLRAEGVSPKLWYGMPAWANKEGNVICFFQDAQKFKTRYATLGFSDKAHLDEGIRDVVTKAGFSRFRRATETPFNIVYEARP